MWHEKNKNFIQPGQRTTFPQRTQGDYLSSKIIPPPSGNHDASIVDGSSRKRKASAMDLPGAGLEYSFSWESNQEFSSDVEMNGQGSDHGVYLNQKNPAEQVTYKHQFHNHEVHCQNDFRQAWLTTNANSYGNGIDPANSLQHKGLASLTTMAVGENIMVPNRQPWACNLSGNTESHRSLPFAESCNAGSDGARSDIDLQGAMRSRISNRGVPDNTLQEICNPSSECPRPVENLHQGFVHPYMSSEGVNGRSCSLEDHDSPSGIRLGNTYESKEQSHGDGIIKTLQVAIASDIEKSKNSLAKDISSKNGSNPDNNAENGQKDDLVHDPLKVKEPNNLSSEKGSSIVAEKLWDGRLQLSSSVTVSAVAYFKSGEKLPDINWSDFVEVKGKVRLQAFEKYIQDLPRSRNRGLMVISLCWKEGSSGTELTGMKEVSKGYKKSAKVGFAQFSSGIDCYICPRSDKIITILAKYGFFKGMTAIEENQDSMIGCVVWKKNQFSSNSVSKNSESKNTSSSERPTDSVSGSSTPQVPEKQFSPTQPTQQSNQSIPLVAVKEQSKLSLEKKDDVIISVQFNPTKARMSVCDDDDLPEYDFGVACGVAMPDRKLPGQGTCPLNGSVSAAMPVVHVISVPSQRSDDINLPRNHSAPNQGMPPLKEVGVHNSEEKQVVCTKNNLFVVDDDDDDMPEWCPPEPYKQQSLVGEASTPSDIHSSSSLKNTTISPVVGPRPVIRPPSPSSASIHSQFSYQPFRPALQQFPPTTKAPLPVVRPSQGSGPSFPAGFNSGPTLRPQSNSLYVRPPPPPPFQFSGRRDQRP